MDILLSFPERISIYAIYSSNAVLLDDEALQLQPSQKVFNHSAEFSWGYLGSGPAQLALAILLKFIPDQEALKYYQVFKEKVIALFPNTTFYRTIPIREQMARVIAEVDGYGQMELFE